MVGGSLGNASASVERADFVSASKLVFVPGPGGQHQLTDRSGEAERGGGSIYMLLRTAPGVTLAASGLRLPPPCRCRAVLRGH